MFMNLVLYRSSVFTKTTGAWLSLPSDASISGSSYVYETSGTISVGDVLRDPISAEAHATIVVYAPSGGPYRVVDSNWVNGSSGNANSEYIGSHTMTFSGTGLNNLGRYKNLTCVYGTGDSRCP